MRPTSTFAAPWPTHGEVLGVFRGGQEVLERGLGLVLFEPAQAAQQMRVYVDIADFAAALADEEAEEALFSANPRRFLGKALDG